MTAIELMPVHQYVQDAHLLEKGLSNYWGYNTIGFFAPHNAYSAAGQRGQQVQEFKAMVKALHAAGIEVILDVVYNHTAEGNHQGPTLCFRGIDNTAYYRLVDEDQAHYFDTTGTGNSLLMRHPHVLQLIMDSLRYWVTEMHVDGFRFDLASSLARQFHEVDRLSAFFDLVQQDPVVSQVKLIAEPWDVGDGGYQVGNFPPLWTEWNGKYRDTRPRLLARRARDARRVRLADHRLGRPLRALAAASRSPSINFITAHDGFTLHDLVSYNDKHNEANGEGDADGESHNRSWNCGVEGDTDDPEVLALRARQQRNFLATLLLSQGVPMIAARRRARPRPAGQQQRLLPGQRARLGRLEARGLAGGAARLQPGGSSPCRHDQPVFRRRRFATGTTDEAGRPEIGWYKHNGERMTDTDWNESHALSMMVFLNGEAIPELDPRGERVVGDSFLVVFNAYHESIPFRVPEGLYDDGWIVALDTSDDQIGIVSVFDDAPLLVPGVEFPVTGRSVVVLRRTAGGAGSPGARAHR